MTELVDRLRRSGLSSRELSERTGLAGDRIRELTDGAEPTLRELRLLAKALGFSVADLVPASDAERHAEVLFRERAVQKRKADVSTQQFTRRVGGALQLLGAERQAPRWLSDFHLQSGTYEDAERAALEFRRQFFHNDYVSPLITLPSLLVNDLDVLVFVGSERAFDGASVILDGHVFIFVAAQFKPRMLFTLAHELGHVLTHHNEDELVILDAPEDVGDFPSRSHRQEEAFADAFASCLLLPREGLGIAIRKIQQLTGGARDQVGDVDLLYLSRIFGVSFEAAARRCEDLGLLPRGGARSLYEHLAKEHESPEKRAEQLGLPARPETEFPPLPPHLVESAIRRIRAGEISIGRAARILNVSIPDIFLLNKSS